MLGYPCDMKNIKKICKKKILKFWKIIVSQSGANMKKVF